MAKPSSWGLILLSTNVNVVKQWFLNISADLEKERAAKEAALSKKISDGPPDDRITTSNWEDFCRYGWFHCPGTARLCGRDKAHDCRIGLHCEAMAAYGLNGAGETVPKHRRAKCGAKTRHGSTCRMAVVVGKARCRLHGGLSTGPKTPEGRERIAAAQRKRWHEAKKKASSEPTPAER
jgi:hypothetical protein